MKSFQIWKARLCANTGYVGWLFTAVRQAGVIITATSMGEVLTVKIGGTSLMMGTSLKSGKNLL